MHIHALMAYMLTMYKMFLPQIFKAHLHYEAPRNNYLMTANLILSSCISDVRYTEQLS